MDRQKKKKMRNARVIMTNIFMALSIIALVSILTLVAMGYSFDKDGTIKQSGLVEISSRPSSATVEIDGNTRFGDRTKINSMLSAGKHSLKITKSGYDTWQRDIEVASGLLTNIDWVRLFPVQPNIENKGSYTDLRLVSYSNDRKNMLVIEKNSDDIKLVDLQGGEAETKKLKLSTILNTTPEKAITGTIAINTWNRDASKVILSWTHANDDNTAELTHHYIADLKSPDKSVNLSEQFNLNFTRILLANDSASKLWVIEEGSLRSIDTTNLTISGLILTNVELITNDRDTVAVVNTDSKGVRAIRVFKEGETGATLIQELGEEEKDFKVTLAMGTYWGDNWLAYTINKQLNIDSGKYPSFDKPSNSSTLKNIVKHTLNSTPNLVSVNEGQRIIIYANDKNVTSIDIQTKNHYIYEADEALTKINWLDEYLIWQRSGDKIIVRDFDGYNRREIISKSNNDYGILLTENSNWLYYFNLKTNAKDLTDCADMNTEATGITSTDCVSTEKETVNEYTLKREALRV